MALLHGPVSSLQKEEGDANQLTNIFLNVKFTINITYYAKAVAGLNSRFYLNISCHEKAVGGFNYRVLWYTMRYAETVGEFNNRRLTMSLYGKFLAMMHHTVSPVSF